MLWCLTWARACMESSGRLCWDTSSSSITLCSSRSFETMASVRLLCRFWTSLFLLFISVSTASSWLWSSAPTHTHNSNELNAIWTFAESNYLRSHLKCDVCSHLVWKPEVSLCQHWHYGGNFEVLPSDAWCLVVGPGGRHIEQDYREVLSHT